MKVFAALLQDFDHRLRVLHIKRDAFLDQVIRSELPHLEKDLNDKRLTPKARRYIARTLKRMGTCQINIVVDKTTAETLKEIVVKSNIVRDAFVNRIIFFLRASEQLLEHLGVSSMARRPRPAPHTAIGVLDAMAALNADPLSPLRQAVEQRGGAGLYLLKLPEACSAFACWLEDSEIPDTASFANARWGTQVTLNEIESFEDMAFSKRTL